MQAAGHDNAPCYKQIVPALAKIAKSGAPAVPETGKKNNEGEKPTGHPAFGIGPNSEAKRTKCKLFNVGPGRTDRKPQSGTLGTEPRVKMGRTQSFVPTVATEVSVACLQSAAGFF